MFPLPSYDVNATTGTAVYLEPLPPPPTLSFQSKEGSQQSISASDTLDSLQSAVDRALQTNRLTYGLLQPSLEVSAQETGSDVMAFDEGTPTEPDLTAGKKDVFLVDISDMNIDGGNIYSIIDRPLPSGYHLSNISLSPGVTAVPNEGKMVTIVKKAIFNNEHRATVDKQFSNFLTLLMQGLCFKVRDYHPCLLSDVQFDIDLPEEDEIQVSVTAFVNRIQQDKSEVKVRRQKRISEEYIFDMDHETSEGLHRPSLLAEVGPHDIGKVVLMSPAPSIAGWSVKQYLGTVNIFVIKESTSIRESGGLGVFLNIFILEANSMVRANVKSMAGNALLNYQLNKCVLIDHPYKNQAQCLLNISGDAVKLVSSSSSIPHDDVTSAVDTSSTSPTETHNLP